MKYTEEMILHSESGYCMPFEEPQGKEVEMTLGYGEQTDPGTGKPFFHHGIDFNARYYRLSAVASGIVSGVGNDPVHGICQTIRYGEYEVTYGHLSNVFAQFGQRVKAGQTVALSGDRLHVEARFKGEELNPLERRQESMIPEKLADQWEDIFPTPPAEHYRLCIQGEGFHADLDREQALLLFRTLFREADTGKMAPLDFAVADWDWTPGEECLRLTEYLDTTGTPYEDSSRIVREQTLFLYPDGTAARVLMSPHNTYYYSWARDIGGISEVEEITPSWTRVHIAEDVFSWDNLNACLEALSVA